MTGSGNPECIDSPYVCVYACEYGKVHLWMDTVPTYVIVIDLHMSLVSGIYKNNRTVETIELLRSFSGCKLVIAALIELTDKSKSAPPKFFFF